MSTGFPSDLKETVVFETAPSADDDDDDDEDDFLFQLHLVPTTTTTTIKKKSVLDGMTTRLTVLVSCFEGKSFWSSDRRLLFLQRNTVSRPERKKEHRRRNRSKRSRSSRPEKSWSTVL